MTARPARRVKLADRGRIAVGMAADLVAFDPTTVADKATFEDPFQYPRRNRAGHGERSARVATGQENGRPHRPIAPPVRLMNHQSDSQTVRPSDAYAWYVVAILTLANVSAYVDRQILTLLVHPIKRDLLLSDSEVSLLGGLSFALFYTVLGFPIARLADQRSRRAIIAWGIGIWSLMTAACGAARNFGQLLLARVGVGVGEAALSPPAYSLIADYFPRERLGTAISVYTMGDLPRGGTGAAHRWRGHRRGERRHRVEPASDRVRAAVAGGLLPGGTARPSSWPRSCSQCGSRDEMRPARRPCRLRRSSATFAATREPSRRIMLERRSSRW
jgi:hypothetical protein